MPLSLQRIRQVVVAALWMPFVTLAAPYGIYDPQKMLTVTETPEGKRHGIDLAYLDRMLGDLSAHAANYPPRFDSAEDRQRATRDAKGLSGMLDVVVNTQNAHPELMLRAAVVNSVGHNLDVPGSTAKADSLFRKLLAAQPAHPRGNYFYGTFLAGAAKPREAIPYLEAAVKLGVADAHYGLGMTHLSLGNKARALESLEAYQKAKPADASVGPLIEAIRNGKLEIKRTVQ